MNLDKYSITEHKLLWHLDRLNDWMDGKPIPPLHIELGICSGCDALCKFCYGQFIGQEIKKFDMPLESVSRLFSDAKEVGVKSITLIGEGENILHRDFYKIIEYAKGINLDLGIATNGISLHKDKILDFLKSFVWIRFSVNGATQNTYLKVQGVNKFDKVIKNIEECVKIKKKYKLKTTIGMQMVLIGDNALDILPMVRLAKELEVDYVVIKPCSDTPSKRLAVSNEKYLEISNQLKEAEKYSDDDFSVIVKWSKLSNLGKNEFKKCYGTAFTIAIDSHGNVAPCAHLLGYRKNEFCMGNIITQSFKDIINNQKYHDIQNKVQSLDVNKECETNCLHNAMNIFLNKLKTPPNHINFP